MTADLAFYRRLREARKVLADPGHPYHDILARELDAWAAMDAEAADADRAEVFKVAAIIAVSPQTAAEADAIRAAWKADFDAPADPCPPRGIPRVGWPKVRPS